MEQKLSNLVGSRKSFCCNPTYFFGATLHMKVSNRDDTHSHFWYQKVAQDSCIKNLLQLMQVSGTRKKLAKRNQPIKPHDYPHQRVNQESLSLLIYHGTNTSKRQWIVSSALHSFTILLLSIPFHKTSFSGWAFYYTTRNTWNSQLLTHRCLLNPG